MDRAYNEAKKRVKTKKKFYRELSVYVAISIFLVFINVFTNSDYLWCFWAIVPWGFGFFIRAIKILTSSKTSQWEQNEMRRELISMGKNPDDYLDDHLELRELEHDNLEPLSKKGYKNSDLV